MDNQEIALKIAFKTYIKLMDHGYTDVRKMAGAVARATDDRIKVRIFSSGERLNSPVELVVYNIEMSEVVRKLKSISYRPNAAAILNMDGIYDIGYSEGFSFYMLAQDMVMAVYRCLGGKGFNTYELLTLLESYKKVEKKFYLVTLKSENQLKKVSINNDNSKIKYAGSGYAALMACCYTNGHMNNADIEMRKLRVVNWAEDAEKLMRYFGA